MKRPAPESYPPAPQPLSPLADTRACLGCNSGPWDPEYYQQRYDEQGAFFHETCPSCGSTRDLVPANRYTRTAGGVLVRLTDPD